MRSNGYKTAKEEILVEYLEEFLNGKGSSAIKLTNKGCSRFLLLGFSSSLNRYLEMLEGGFPAIGKELDWMTLWISSNSDSMK